MGSIGKSNAEYLSSTFSHDVEWLFVNSAPYQIFYVICDLLWDNAMRGGSSISCTSQS